MGSCALVPRVASRTTSNLTNQPIPRLADFPDDRIDFLVASPRRCSNNHPAKSLQNAVPHDVLAPLPASDINVQIAVNLDIQLDSLFQ